jgi:hypothetical protein
MGEQREHQDIRSVSIRQGEQEIRIEEILPAGSGPAKLRFSSSSTQPVEVSEADLVILLQKAIRDGILSAEFVSDLRSEFLI